MKHLIVVLGLMVSGICMAQQIDSLEIFHPEGKLLHTFNKDNLLGKKLDSLNKIYKTDEFYVRFFSGRQSETRRFYAKKDTVKRLIKKIRV